MRFRVLDLYRFFAALIVMGFHYNLAFNAWFGGTNLFVDFFFMLSGFVMLHGYEGRVSDPAECARFLVARFARIYPLHFVTTTLWLILAGVIAVTGRHVEHPITVRPLEVINEYLLTGAWGATAHLPLNGPSWSISAEWGLYLLFPLFVWMLRRLGPISLALLAIGTLAALEIAGDPAAFANPAWLEWTFHYGVLRAIPSFLAGMWMSGLTRKAPSQRFGVGAGAIVFALSLLLVYLDVPRLVVLVALGLSIYFTASGERRGQKTWLSDPRLAVFGDASYAIYMTHLLTLTLLAPALKPMLHNEVAVQVSVMFITVGLAIACHRYFERPAQSAINGLWARRAAARPQSPSAAGAATDRVGAARAPTGAPAFRQRVAGL